MSDLELLDILLIFLVENFYGNILVDNCEKYSVENIQWNFGRMGGDQLTGGSS